MAPTLTAAAFQSLYGNLCSEHFGQYTTARTLRIALSKRKPPIIVTDGILKIWFAKFRLPSDAVTVSSAEELHRRYGDFLPALAAQNPTAYCLTRVLAKVLVGRSYLTLKVCSRLLALPSMRDLSVGITSMGRRQQCMTANIVRLIGISRAPPIERKTQVSGSIT